MSELWVQQAVAEARVPRLPEVRAQLGVTVEIPAEGRVLVSACLAGVACTHEAQPKTREFILRLVNDGRVVLVCPEVAGGLPIPRPAAEIAGGDGDDVLDGHARVISETGEDVTDNYLAGARKAADAARAAGARFAILKARSPSCGCGAIHSGAFDGELRDGDGVTAAMLKREGLEVVSDETVE